MDLKNKSDEEIVELLKEKKISSADLTDNGICPTCFNKKYNGVVFHDNPNTVLYEDDKIFCTLEGRPRCPGHTIILTKEHYKDIMDLPNDLLAYITCFATKLMRIIKEEYGSESVYLVTMCDGPMNHFHYQLIPRYNYEKRGSTNFVKERQDLEIDYDKVQHIRKLIRK